MAVEFNLQVALQQEGYARKCYQKYCNGEMEISDDDLQALRDQYKGKMDNWKPDNVEDQNDYEIEDDDKGDDVSGQVGRGLYSAGATAAGAASNFFSAGLNIGILGCLMAFAEGLVYTLTNPNKAEHEELMKLKDTMLGSQTAIKEAGENVEVTQEEIDAVLAEYENDKDAIRAAIEQKTEELHALEEKRDALQKDAESDEGLDESEQAKLEELNEQIGTLSHEIDVLHAALIAETEETQDEVEEGEGELGEAFEITEDAKDAAELAATFDEQTRENAITEVAIQELNVIGGTLSVASVAPQIVVNPFAAAAAAAGTSGVVMSGIGVYEQTKIAVDVAEEIDIRKDILDQIEDLDGEAGAGIADADAGLVNVTAEDVEVPEQEPEPEMAPEPGVDPDPEPEDDDKKEEDK